MADSQDSDQTTQMRRLIGVFAGAHMSEGSFSYVLAHKLGWPESLYITTDRPVRLESTVRFALLPVDLDFHSGAYRFRLKSCPIFPGVSLILKNGPIFTGAYRFRLKYGRIFAVAYKFRFSSVTRIQCVSRFD